MATGEIVAYQVATLGINLVIVARRQEKLAKLARDLQHQYAIEVRTVSIDINQQNFMELIEQACQCINIDVVVSNAGQPSHMGLFIERPFEEVETMLRFITFVQVKLAHNYSRLMAARQSGGIIMVGSYAGYGPIPYMAEHSASKAFQLTSGEALHFELESSGVDLLVLSPGATKTERISFGMDAGPVVALALKSIGKRTSVVPGSKNQLTILIGRYLKSRRKYLYDYGRLISRMMPGWSQGPK